MLMTKKISILLVTIFLINLVLPIINNAASLPSDVLIIVNGKTIKENMKVDEVNELLGNPTYESKSAYGGKIYSYTDSDYSYYAYIETNTDGKIMSYGAIGGNFKANHCDYGDDGCNILFDGFELSNYYTKDKVWGVLEYNTTYLEDEQYWKKYQEDSSGYLYALQEHMLISSKVIAKMQGKELIQNVANEEIFYTNEQLKDNNQYLSSYADNAGKYDYIKVNGSSPYNFSRYYRPSPLMFSNSINTMFPSNYEYILFDVAISDYDKISSGRLSLYYIDPNFLEEKKTIPLTEEEQNKLNAAQREYDSYLQNMDKANEKESYYDEEPHWQSLPLVAGKYSKEVLQASTNFLNIARAGIGIPTVTLDEDMADAALHKAVLNMYINNVLGGEGGHDPEQPEGVDDAFYQKAMKYTAENLFFGTIITSIMSAVSDSVGDPYYYGHRYNLLNPSWSKWGIGSVGSGISYGWQSAQKMGGSADFNNELVAWPSNGIMPIDMIYGNLGEWTVKFYKNYSVTPNTTVTIKCLNNDKVYEINENNPSKGKILRYAGDILIFEDTSLSYENGDVFEITLHNVKDSSDNPADYKYRTVFHSFYSDKNNKPVTDIQVNQTNATLVVGQTERIIAKALPDDASLKLMRFSSSTENVVKVRQDGTVTALEEGTAIITITCGNKTKQVTIQVKDGILGDINFDGRVDSKDASQVLLYNVGKIELNEKQKLLADMNGDGSINSKDASDILIYNVGKQ